MKDFNVGVEEVKLFELLRIINCAGYTPSEGNRPDDMTRETVERSKTMGRPDDMTRETVERSKPMSRPGDMTRETVERSKTMGRPDDMTR